MRKGRSGRRKVKVKRKNYRRYNRPYPGGFQPIDGGRVYGQVMKRGSGSMMPSAKRIKMKYGYAQNPSLASGGQFTWIWRLNSLFDPDKSGIGNQPLGYDQWSAFYQRYLVHACKLKFTVTNSSNEPVLFSCHPDYDLGATASTVPHIIDKPDSAYCLVTKQDGAQTLEYYANIKDFFGLDKLTKEDTEYTAESNQNPAKPAQLIFQADVLSGIGVAEPIHVLIDMTFYMEMFEPIELQQS